MQLYINPPAEQWSSITTRPVINRDALFELVSKVLDDVKTEGDAAVRKYTLQFDRVEINNMRVSESEFELAETLLSDELKGAIRLAKSNIEKFHRAQQKTESPVETSPGVICWRKTLPIEKVGLYIPGGSAPLFSTLLMLGIPASLAGCKEIVVCTPPSADGSVHPAILYVAQLLGLEHVYKIGGVQAIGAMAYGTETIPRVFKIFGPGNQFVTAAKEMVTLQGVAIDLPAGPSEVAVYADDTCVPSFVAADLLSQAEHGTDSQVILVASNHNIVQQVLEEIAKQLPDLPRVSIINASLQHSKAVVIEDINLAFRLLNEYAPEHLIIATDKAAELANLVTNAGSVFLGNYSPESAGDYASGTNHTLPTQGYAKASAGVSVDSFVRKTTFQQMDRRGLGEIGWAIETMAAAEGLQAHKNAVSIRLKKEQAI